MDSSGEVSGGLTVDVGFFPSFQFTCQNSSSSFLVPSATKWKYSLHKTTTAAFLFVNGVQLGSLTFADSSACSTMWGKTTTTFKLEDDDTATTKVVFPINGRWNEKSISQEFQDSPLSKCKFVI